MGLINILADDLISFQTPFSDQHENARLQMQTAHAFVLLHKMCVTKYTNAFAHFSKRVLHAFNFFKLHTDSTVICTCSHGYVMDLDPHTIGESAKLAICEYYKE